MIYLNINLNMCFVMFGYVDLLLLHIFLYNNPIHQLVTLEYDVLDILFLYVWCFVILQIYCRYFHQFVLYVFLLFVIIWFQCLPVNRLLCLLTWWYSEVGVKHLLWFLVLKLFCSISSSNPSFSYSKLWWVPCCWQCKWCMC